MCSFSCKGKDVISLDIHESVIIDEEVALDIKKNIPENIDTSRIFFPLKPKDRVFTNYSNQIKLPNVETIISLPLQNILSAVNSFFQFNIILITFMIKLKEK